GVVAVIIDRRIVDSLLSVLLRRACGMQHTFGRVEVQEEFDARAILIERAVIVQENLPERIILVIESEFARAARNVRMGELALRIRRVEAQRVARIERMAVVGLGYAGQVKSLGILYLREGQLQRLGARDRVIARATMDPVAAQAAEDDVV